MARSHNTGSGRSEPADLVPVVLGRLRTGPGLQVALARAATAAPPNVPSDHGAPVVPHHLLLALIADPIPAVLHHARLPHPAGRIIGQFCRPRQPGQQERAAPFRGLPRALHQTAGDRDYVFLLPAPLSTLLLPLPPCTSPVWKTGSTSFASRPCCLRCCRKSRTGTLPGVPIWICRLLRS